MGIRNLENVDHICNHPGIWDVYVQRPTGRGLLAALNRAQDMHGTRNIVEIFANNSESCKLVFRDFFGKWILLNEISRAELQILRVLPMMSTIEGSGNCKSHFVSAADVDFAAARDSRPGVPLPSPQILLDLSDETSYQLAVNLRIKLKRIEDILIEVYFPAVNNNYYTTDDVIVFMKYICNYLKDFDSKIIPFAAEVKFISNQEGNLLKPCDLYNKEEALVATLFQGEDVFPYGEFASPTYNDALRKLGLKGSQMITSDEVLKIAKEVELNTDVKQSGALMFLLNRQPELLNTPVDVNNCTLKSELYNIKWLKTFTKRPDSYPAILKFTGEEIQHKLASPEKYNFFKICIFDWVYASNSCNTRACAIIS